MFCWALHTRGGPKPSECAVVAVKHKVYAFGAEWKFGVSVFNTVSLRWTKLPPAKPPYTPPHQIQGHTAVLIGDTVYIWGGWPALNGLYAYDLDSHVWSKPWVSGDVPELRSHTSACVLGTVMFIHGGWTWFDGPAPSNDTHKLDTSTMVWSLIIARGIPPLASAPHSATIIGTKMFVIGGSKYVGVFDTETNCWLNAQPLPDGCKRSNNSVFAHNGELYIFGIFHWGHAFSHLWKFSPETVSWTKVEPNFSKGKERDLSSPHMGCCMVGDRIIAFSGKTVIILDLNPLNPSLKTMCKLAVIQYGLEQSELPYDIRWELAAMTPNE